MIVLTFDVEEFDTPEEYGREISFEEKIKVSTNFPWDCKEWRSLFVPL